MTQIFVNGLPAVIKAGTSFEFCVENPSFSDADGYTLNIEFPMEGCPENEAVFGHICRDDVPEDTGLLPCRIVSGTFYREGALAITGVTDSLVKGQFLEGVDSENEELDIDTLYVNELDLGKYPVSLASEISPEDARKGTDSEICLPWIPIGYDVVNCRASGPDSWHEETVKLSWQPRLTVMIRRIAEAAGYVADMSPFEGTCWERAIICNTLPPTWEISGYAAALPAWTVREFFSRLGLFLKGNFSFDETRKTISFMFWSDVREAMPVVTLQDIIDGYSSDVSRNEEDAGYLPVKRFRYKSQDLPVWKYLDAPFVRRGGSNVSEFENYEDYRNNGQTTVGPDGHRTGSAQIIYLKDIDTFFCFRTVQLYSKGHVADTLAERYPYAHYQELHPVGVFSPPDYDSDTDYEDLEVCPVAVDYALEGKFMWLPVSSDSESGSMLAEDDTKPGDGISLKGGVRLTEDIYQGKTRVETYMESDAMHGSDTGKEEYFTELYIGILHDGMTKRPYPLTDVDVFNRELVSTDTFMRLSEGGAGGVAIDPKVRCTFRFLADSIPDIRGMFCIHGKLYVAGKITATFTEHGMSEILKGEFFRVL